MSVRFALYDCLAKNDSVEPADLIFVLAGRMERKRYGVDLYRARVAPALLLSVGRFEVSRLHTLDLPADGLQRLISVRDQTAPRERNFFIHLDTAGMCFELSVLPRASTYGEVFALRERLRGTEVRKVLVISTDAHLRRAELIFKALFRKQAIEFRYCPVPPHLSSETRDEWWKVGRTRGFILTEWLKLIGYWLILLLPEGVARRIMTAARIVTRH